MCINRIIKKMHEQDSGNLVIEASFVLTITVVMIAVLINLGFMLYEQNLLEATAHETATEIANVYSSLCRDPEIGYVNDSNFYKTNLYRYVTNYFNSTQDNKAIRKGQWFALYKIRKGNLIEDEPKNIKVDIERRANSMLMNQVVVTITSEYEIPLTRLWGGKNKMVFTANARANCIDLLDYFGTVSMIEDDIIKKLDKFTERFTKFINTFDFSSLVK